MYQEQAEKLKAVVESVNQGHFPVVEINENVFPESYLEPRMRARIVAVRDVKRRDGDQDEYAFSLKFTEFDAYNSQYQVADWPDKDGNACLTADQAGQRPENGIEEMWCVIADEPVMFDLIDYEGSSVIYAEYLDYLKTAEPNALSYTSWLEHKIQELRGCVTKS